MQAPLHRAALPRTLVLALVLGAAAACADAPTAVRTASSPRRDGATATRTLRRPALIANHVKYRDAGAHPASGKAGAATLYMQALLGHDGKTEVQVATSDWAFLYGWAPGEITQLQVKALGQDGHPITTRVHTGDLPGGGTATFSYGGMARGTTLQAQAAVRGIDPHRTDVPVVTGAVRLRPNLAVTGVTAPGRVPLGGYATVLATIAETNGDLGESNDCRLYVDGQYADWAQGIWVDAGDVVNCLFAVSFLYPGTHQVEVRLGAGSPRDDNPADNAAAVQVEAYASNEMYYTASLTGFETQSHNFYRNTWVTRDSAGVESVQQYQDDTRVDMRYRAITLDAWIYRGMSQRPRVEVVEETNGVQVFSGSFELEDLLWDPSGSCGFGVDTSVGVTVFGCTANEPYPYSSVSYVRLTNHTTYYSAGFSRTYDGYTGEEQVYSYNYDLADAQGLPLAELGSDYTIRLRLDDGVTQFFATPTFPLQARETREDVPATCFFSEYPWVMVTNEYCLERQYYSREVSGRGWSYQ